MLSDYRMMRDKPFNSLDLSQNVPFSVSGPKSQLHGQNPLL